MKSTEPVTIPVTQCIRCGCWAGHTLECSITVEFLRRVPLLSNVEIADTWRKLCEKVAV